MLYFDIFAINSSCTCPRQCTFKYPSWANLCSHTLDCTANLQLIKQQRSEYRELFVMNMLFKVGCKFDFLLFSCILWEIETLINHNSRYLWYLIHLICCASSRGRQAAWATTISPSVPHISFFLFRQPWATTISPCIPPHLTLPGKTTFLNGIIRESRKFVVRFWLHWRPLEGIHFH